MKLLKSKLLTLLALLVVIVLIVVAYVVRMQWWMLFDVMFAFVGVFCHLMALNFEKFSVHSAHTMDRISLVCLILSLISFLVIYFFLQ